jgi:DNA-binding IclR family transcriptional regulator
MAISELCKELGITKPTLYRYLALNGALKEYGKRLLGVVEL